MGREGEPKEGVQNGSLPDALTFNYRSCKISMHRAWVICWCECWAYVVQMGGGCPITKPASNSSM